MKEVRYIKISDLCRKICSGGTPKSSEPSYYNGSIPWLNTKEVNFNRIYSTEKNITVEGLKNSSAKWIEANSIIVAMYGATAGKTAISTIPLTTNQACCNLMINEHIADYRYVYYALKSNYEKLASLANGGAQQNLNAQQIKDFEIPYLSLSEQKNIANVLSSFDDKIELNNRINENLEQQAQALFKSWFVDFEPFKNGKFIDSEFGRIPEGWKVVTLGEVTTHVSKKVKTRTNIKVLSPVTTGNLVLSEDYFKKQVYSTNIEKYIIVKPMQFAYNPARINIGSIGMNTYEFDGCVSPVYVVFECEKDYQYFFDCFRKTSQFKEEVISRAIGGVRQSLNYTDFSLIKTIYPPKHVIINFNDIYLSILKLKTKLNAENLKLSILRDNLLPRLIFGDLNIDENRLKK